MPGGMELRVARRERGISHYRLDAPSLPTAAGVEAFLGRAPGRIARVLRSLIVPGAALERIPDLAALPRLEELLFAGGRFTSLDGIERAPRLQRLSLRMCGRLRDLDAAARLRALEQIELFECPAVRDLSALGERAGLCGIVLNRCPAARLDSIGRHRGLETLRATGGSGGGAIGEVLVDFPALRSLELGGTSGLPDLGFAASLAELRELRLFGVKGLVDASALGDCEELRVVVLMGCTSLRTIEGLERCRKLSHVQVEGCPRLERNDALLERRGVKVYWPQVSRAPRRREPPPLPLASLLRNGTRVEQVDGAAADIRIVRGPWLRLPTGRLVACDPYVGGARALRGRFEPGAHPVVLSLARRRDRKSPRVAAATVRLAARPPVRFRRIGRFDVDSATAAFLDASVVGRLRDRAFARRLDGLGPRSVIADDDSGANVVLFPSGFGDGGYAVYAGFDARGRPVCVTMDLAVVRTTTRP